MYEPTSPAVLVYDGWAPPGLGEYHPGRRSACQGTAPDVRTPKASAACGGLQGGEWPVCCGPSAPSSLVRGASGFGLSALDVAALDRLDAMLWEAQPPAEAGDGSHPSETLLSP
eukprot:1991134-Prymnesium_polylepis.1